MPVARGEAVKDLFFDLLLDVLDGPETAFVVLNPRDYTERAMLNFDRHNYEPETLRSSLARGFVGAYKRADGTTASLYVRREVEKGKVIRGKAGDNPLEPIVPRDFAPVPEVKS